MKDVMASFCRLGTLGALGVLVVFSACAPRSSAPLAINEVLPSNGDNCADEAGERNDWVEIYNKGTSAVDLGGYSLTDDTASPRKTVLPEGLTIEAGGALLLWGDGTPEQGANHLSFKLKSKTERVVLYDPEEKQIDLFAWADAVTDVSFARVPDGTGAFVLCATPTCGTPNGVFMRPVALASQNADVPSNAALNYDVPDRYELKYVIPESQVDTVRGLIEPFCVLDPNSARSPDREYIIESLYLDTPTRDLFRISKVRAPRRWKARIRHYALGPNPTGTVFLEIKNKSCDLIIKSRARVPAEDWARRLTSPLRADASPAEKHFRAKLERHGLVPTLLVRYQREAWMSLVDSYARVTFDRRVTCQPWHHWNFDGNPSGWQPIDNQKMMRTVPHAVVLELKCTMDVPRWLSNLTRGAELTRASFSKYCNGVERIWGRDALSGFLSYCT